MAGDNKVVDLQKVKSDAEQARADALAIPLPIMKLTALFKTTVITSFKKMFEEADDILFARADKAGSSSEQVAYFDAMRDMRLNKKNIESTFLKSVGVNIQNLDKPKSQMKEATLICAEELSLVGLDDMESEVAIESMVSKIRDHAARSIEQLQIRVQTLYPRVEISADRMPFSPNNLCHAFADALSGLDMDIRPRLIVFKLFDRFFTESLSQFYVAANQLLVKQGILPEMVIGRSGTKSTAPAGEVGSREQSHAYEPVGDVGLMGDEVGLSVGRAEPPGSVATGGATNTWGGASYSGGGSGMSFALLQKALRSQALPNSGGAIGGRMSGFLADSDNESRGYSPQELVGALSACESRFYPGGNAASDGAIRQNLVADLLAEAHQQMAQKGQQKHINQREADVANLVSLLFNFVLEDDQLPEKLKTILASWQIPFLKLALLDSAFFERDSHPARHLLNQVSKAAMGWQPKEKGRDLLLEKLEKFTDKMLYEFDTDAGVFTEINQEMTLFLDAEKKRSALISQRLKDAEEGRVKSELAKKKVSGVLSSLMAGRRLPDVLVQSLEHGWSRKMTVAWLQGGEQSSDWQEACEFVQDLLWTVDPQEKGVDARGKLLHLVPRILRDFREGLMEVSFDLRGLDKVMATLDMCHKESLRRIEEVDKPFGDGVSDKPKVGNAMANVSRLPVAPYKADSSTLIAEPDGVGVTEGAFFPKTEAETIWEQRVDQLRLGSWFEYLPKEGEKQRFKLAAAIKMNGRHVFVNRNGVKMAEFEKPELIRELASGRLMPLDDGQIFDRALESIISGLRR